MRTCMCMRVGGSLDIGACDVWEWLIEMMCGLWECLCVTVRVCRDPCVCAGPLALGSTIYLLSMRLVRGLYLF